MLPISSHPMARRIRMLQGSSIDPAIVAQVTAMAEGKKVLVVLDSNHTHAHVLAELEAYAPLASVGSYCVVFDTVVEDMPPDAFAQERQDGLLGLGQFLHVTNLSHSGCTA